MRPQQAAHKLAISRSKVYELLATGEIESIRIGRSRRIPAESLRRWIERQAA